MRKRLVLTVLVMVAALLSWVVWIAADSYIHAPRLVAEMDRAGVLPCSLSELTRDRLCALLAVQDPTFYRHQGIGLADGHLGHTTITQSVAKGLFFHGFNPGLLHHRKTRLMVAAWAARSAHFKGNTASLVSEPDIFRKRRRARGHRFSGCCQRLLWQAPGSALRFGILRFARHAGCAQQLPRCTPTESERRARREDSTAGAACMWRRMFSRRCTYAMHDIGCKALNQRRPDRPLQPTSGRGCHEPIRNDGERRSRSSGKPLASKK